MRKENSKFKTKFLSEAGSQIKNTDYFAFVELEEFACYCVADGIDRDRKKESAKLIVEEVIRTFLEKPKCNHNCLKRCMEAANELILNESTESRLEASLLIIITDYKKFIYANAGNIRLYHIRNAAIKNVTIDQSLSENLVASGQLPKDKVREHEERHNLYCYMGMAGRIRPDYSKKIELQDGDTVILCTKGVWEYAGDPEILDSLDDAKEPENLCDSIEELILSRKKQELGSYTIVCIFTEKVYKDPSKKKKIVKKVIMITIPILIAAITISIVLYVQHKKRIEKINSMLEHKQTGIEYIEEDNYTRALSEFEEAIKAVKSVKMKKNTFSYSEKELTLHYKKLAELMVDANKSLDETDYKAAISYYENAVRQAALYLDLDDSDMDYIREQKILAISYLEVLEHIQTGEKYDTAGAYDDSIEEYTKAFNLASEIFYVEGKEEASKLLSEAKLNRLTKEQEGYKEEAANYEKKAKKAEDKELPDKAKSYYKKAYSLYKKAGDTDKQKEMTEKIEALEEEAEDKEKAEEKETREEYKAKAEASIAKGDQASEAEDYDLALTYYQEAIDYYTEAEMAAEIAAVDVKISAIQSKNTDTAKKEKQAEAYIESASKYEKIEDYDTALLLWGLAKDIYTELGQQEKVKYAKKYIQNLTDKLNEYYDKLFEGSE
jgi:serine/threonine protein phosphatase PrpC